jgi:hypothetical protein
MLLREKVVSLFSKERIAFYFLKPIQKEQNEQDISSFRTHPKPRR